MNQKLVSIFLSKYAIAAILAVTIIVFLPEYFNKYNLDVVEEKLSDVKASFYYYDIDNDGWSETIKGLNDQNNEKFPAINVFTKDGILIDQWNFRGTFLTENKQIFSSDANQNGFKELFFFTQVEDSIFLNIIEPLGEDGRVK